MKKPFRNFLLLLLLLSACRAAPTPTPTVPPTTIPPPTAAAPTAPATPTPVAGNPFSGIENAPWWNDAVFYEVFVRSFYDSDGDGVGDLNGLIAKLDYLNDGDPATQDDLGVTGLWLMPIMQSPSYHGYDVVDYYTVDDEYGTNEDFKRLMDEAHRRGIRVIVDLVLNHTSAQHPWFQDARTGAEAEYRDWYVWSDRPGSATGWHADATGSYFGIFWDQMPDLNYENPAVTAEMQRVVRFWLADMGVDGFRLDAIKHLIEDGATLENTPATHAWFEQNFFPFYKSIAPDALTVAEVWSSTDLVVPYIGDEVDLAFDFDLASAFLEAAGSGSTLSLEYAAGNTAGYPAGQFATFLANHDQTRTRSQLLTDAQAEVAATLHLTFPGVPFIYYGEEIGMQGGKPDEDIRRPMQWTDEGGFSSGAPWRDYFGDQAERNVAAQQTEAGSLWQHYRALIALRAAHPALRMGAWLPVKDDHRRVYSFVRVTDEETLLVLVNLSQEPVTEYTLTLTEGPFQAGIQPTLLLGTGETSAPTANARGGFAAYRPVEALPAYGSVIIQYRP